jgi:hypothetical protein
MSLKYYSDERAMYPWHSEYRVNADEGLNIVFRAFWHFGLPALNVDFTRKHGDGFFRWSWFKSETKRANRISLSRVSAVRVILHEIAHYMDYLNRVQQMTKYDTTGQNGFSADMVGAANCRRIRKEHWHGPRHKVEMDKLIKWFDEDYRKNNIGVDAKPTV